MKFDLIYWWAGRLWGERVIHLFAGQRERQRRRGLKFVERVNRWGPKFTWPAIIITPFLPLPNAIVYAVAGWTGMSWVTFLILDAIGSLAWAGMLAGLGYALGQHAVSVAQDDFQVRAVGIDRHRRPRGSGADEGRASATLSLHVHIDRAVALAGACAHAP